MLQKETMNSGERRKTEILFICGKTYSGLDSVGFVLHVNFNSFRKHCPNVLSVTLPFVCNNNPLLWARFPFLSQNEAQSSG